MKNIIKKSALFTLGLIATAGFAFGNGTPDQSFQSSGMDLTLLDNELVQPQSITDMPEFEKIMVYNESGDLVFEGKINIGGVNELSTQVILSQSAFMAELGDTKIYLMHADQNKAKTL